MSGVSPPSSCRVSQVQGRRDSWSRMPRLRAPPPHALTAVISSLVSRTSAVVLLVGGLALLFGADAILPALVPGVPRAAAWLGQLLGAAWLALAALNWLQRATTLGGIYGRPLVLALAGVYGVLLFRGPLDPRPGPEPMR